eukprot:Gb_22014 [translate_table: standard]
MRHIHGMIRFSFNLSIHFVNTFSVFLNPKKPCSLLLFILLKFSKLKLNTTPIVPQCAKSSSLVLHRLYSAPIASHNEPLSFISSGRLKPSPLYSSNSNSNLSARIFHSLFHLKTSPLVQLNAWFLARGSETAHISCSATSSASDASVSCSQLDLLPGNLSGFPSYLQIVA